MESSPEISPHPIPQTLSETERTRVLRAQLPGGERVILKCLKPAAATTENRARVRREFALLTKAAIPGVVKAARLDESQSSLTLVLEDIGGASLDRLARRTPLPLPQFLDLAIGLARTLAGLHQRRIIHKAICPAHIILNATTGQFRLIGFGQADEQPQSTVAVQRPAAFEEILPYVSPERTGRMNRAVDYRTDLYSLGATFYQLLTGRPPFVADDALGLIHCHIAAIPDPPSDQNSSIPGVLSRIVLKLLAKMAEDRYQSGWGLQADLERCRGALLERGEISEFEPGQQDFSDQLQIPQKLYGREKEVEQLLGAFERIREGGRELLLVGGYAGVGKTALVHEVQRSIVGACGYFLEGKFDQLQRNVPYFAWIQAFTELVHALLMENERELARWKACILRAVGNIGRVLTELIPELELVIGAQPAVPALGAAEAQNRLSYVFLQFVRAMTTSEHPLVIFLDDLQWIDAASLNLLQTLATSVGVSHLLVIGAYRDNEVDALHPLTLGLERLRQERASIARMVLLDLDESTINELIAETLHTPAPRAGTLTHLLYAKTGGNPFFLLQTLRTLVDQQAISFDLEHRGWRWDVHALEQMAITDNVVTLMLGRIQQLPLEAQRLLPLAACIGFRFDPANLGVIAEEPEERTRDLLQPTLREGVLMPMGEAYQFVHDRIQQAAYSLIPEPEKKQVHLEIGRLLLEHMPEENVEAQLFPVVDHLNIGRDLLETREERLELARLNLRAGQRAKSSAAFIAAARYFEVGVTLLDQECWATHYTLTLELHSLMAEAATLVGDFKRSGQEFRLITKNAKSVLDVVGAYESRFNSFAAQGRLQDSMDTALEILDKLGVHFPRTPTPLEIQRNLEDVMRCHAGKSIADLIDLPRMTEPLEVAIMHVLDLALGSAYSGRPDLFALFSFEAVRRTIKSGQSPESMYAYSCYSLLLCGMPAGSIDDGYQFGELAVRIAERAPACQQTPKVIGTTVAMTWQYKRHLRDTLPVLRQYFQPAKEVGNFEHAGYITCFLSEILYLCGSELVELEHEMTAYDEANRQIRAEVARRWQTTFLQAVKNLIGKSPNPCILKGEAYDVDAMLPILGETQNLAGKSALYVNTLILCHLFGEHERALDASGLAEKNQAGMVGMTLFPAWLFYDSLTRLALYPRASQHERDRFLERVAANQAYLEMRAHHAPMNCLHEWHLVEAEKARVLDRGMEAMEHYDRAIALAGESGFIQEEALANEHAGRFWMEKRKPEFARVHVRKAYEGYRRWKAWAKVKALEGAYPQWLNPRDSTHPEGWAVSLDVDALTKATRTIAGEMEMDRLLSQVMHIAIQNAGAQRGFLLMKRDGQWDIVARGEMGKPGAELSRPAVAAQSDQVAASVVHFVARTRGRVVLADAANTAQFLNDPHIRQDRTKSLLCAPLLSRGRVTGVVYLENNLTTDAFTPERIQLLEMLLSQAATSWENAEVYQALKESEAKYRRIVETANEGIWLLESDGRVVFANPQMAKMLGYVVEEVVGRPVTEFFFEEDLPDHTQRMQLRRQEVAEHYERRLRRKDGSTLWAVVSTTPIFDAQHRFQGSFGMTTDITERKQAEEEVRRLNWELDRRVSQRTAALERANSALGRANKELETFSYSVSHDLRAPLRAITGFSDILQKKYSDKLDPNGLHYLHLVVSGAERMGHMIEDILAFSRMSRTAMGVGRVDMTSLAREVMTELQAGVPERRIRFVLDALPAAIGDRAMLRQVWSNLLGNAIKYSAQREEILIEVSGSLQETESLYWVKDNGAGFDMRSATKLFGVFQRLHSSKQFEGTGVGLAIVQRIIQRHGGRIWAEAKVDHGATFHFALPVQPEAVADK